VSELKPLVFDGEFDRLWREAQESFSVAVVRSKQYLNWRYANPSATYIGLRADLEGRLCGYCVVSYLSTGKLKTAWVADLLFTVPQVGAALLQQILRRTKQDGADVVIMWDGKDIRGYCRHLGFRKSWLNQRLCISIQPPHLPDEFIGDISNWYLTVADTEDWI
jgi:hypothetical protein